MHINDFAAGLNPGAAIAHGNDILRGISVHNPMTRMLTIQTCGTLVVLGAFALAEVAAYALDASPNWDLAWYLNVVVFRSFERARVVSSPLNGAFGISTLPTVLVLIAVAIAFRLMRLRLAVALMANLSFGAALLLAHAGLSSETGPATASLSAISLRPKAETWTVGLIIITSFVAFATSHAGFILAIWRDTVGRRAEPFSPADRAKSCYASSLHWFCS